MKCLSDRTHTLTQRRVSLHILKKLDLLQNTVSWTVLPVCVEIMMIPFSITVNIWSCSLLYPEFDFVSV